MDTALEKEQPEDHALALGLILQIFYLLNKPADESTHHEEYFPQNVLDIQHYLDTHFAEVSTVAEVAEHFFYSGNTYPACSKNTSIPPWPTMCCSAASYIASA